MPTSIRLSKLLTAHAWIFPDFDMLCQGEAGSSKHNFVTLSTYCFLLLFNFPAKLFISSAAASESHSCQLISNVKITLFLFWETALGFPQNLQGLRFPIFRGV